MSLTLRIRSVTPLHDFHVKLVFSDGSERNVDLESHLNGPIFDPVRKNPDAFRKVRVEPDFGGLEWPNGADICPDVLRDGHAPSAREDAG